VPRAWAGTRGCSSERSARRSAPEPGARPVEPTDQSRSGCPIRFPLSPAWDSKPCGCHPAGTSRPAAHVAVGAEATGQSPEPRPRCIRPRPEHPCCERRSAAPSPGSLCAAGSLCRRIRPTVPTSRRRRPQHRPATIGYRASRHFAARRFRGFWFASSATRSHSPELNPVERLWHWFRVHHWSNRTYANEQAPVARRPPTRGRAIHRDAVTGVAGPRARRSRRPDSG